MLGSPREPLTGQKTWLNDHGGPFVYQDASVAPSEIVHQEAEAAH